MRLSLSSFIYYNYPLSEAIRRTAAAGFDGIDIWGGRPHAYRKDLGDKEIADLRQTLQSEGLAVASFIPAQFRYPTSLCSPIEKIRQDSVSYIQDSIETAVALGAPVVSVCPGHTLFGQSTEDGIERLSESLCAIAEYATSYELLIAIEPADRYETDLLPTCAATLDLVNKLGYAYLGVLLDNGHAHVVGEPAADAVRLLGDKLFHVHVDDNDGERDQHLVPGDGSFEFSPFMVALRQTGYDGFLAAELGWDYTIDPDPAARLTVERMNDIQSQG
ncbi:MAG: sugar phosphate isomerase/epimerase [Chloroflexota bacterium]|nr:sugar phosphate isomerase/epimerase [Chloroflexota bacterium]